MVTRDVTSDVIDVLGQRVSFLECVQEGEKDKRTLVDSLEFSRSTVDRGVRELEALGFLTFGNDGYEPTTCGRMAAEGYRQFEHQVRTLLEFQPLLQWIDFDDCDFDLRWLVDATLYTPERGDPYAMINRHVQLVKQATTGRFLLPYVGQHATEAAHESVHQHDGEHELIVAPSVVETFQTNPTYAEMIEKITEVGSVHVFVYDEPFPYSLAIIDDEIVQIVADENEEPRALLESNTPEIREWAHQKFEEFKQQSARMI